MVNPPDRHINMNPNFQPTPEQLALLQAQMAARLPPGMQFPMPFPLPLMPGSMPMGMSFPMPIPLPMGSFPMMMPSATLQQQVPVAAAKRKRDDNEEVDAQPVAKVAAAESAPTDEAPTIDVEHEQIATEAAAAPPPEPEIDLLDQPYKPGILMDLPEIITMARKIAEHLDADYEDKDAVKKATEAQKELELSIERAENALQQHEQNQSKQTEKALADAEAKARIAERNLEKALAAKAKAYRESVRGHIQRVTGQVGSAGAGAGGFQSVGTEGGAIEVVHSERPTMVCANCGNADEGLFLHDPRQGDVVCTRCGRVAVEHAMHDGAYAVNAGVLWDEY